MTRYPWCNGSPLTLTVVVQARVRYLRCSSLCTARIALILSQFMTRHACESREGKLYSTDPARMWSINQMHLAANCLLGKRPSWSQRIIAICVICNSLDMHFHAYPQWRCSHVRQGGLKYELLCFLETIRAILDLLSSCHPHRPKMSFPCASLQVL